MRATRISVILALAVAAAVLTCGCTSPAGNPAANETNGTQTVENLSIAEVLGRDGNFSIYLRAFDAAGLAGTLDGRGPYTVFAPTDEAFGRFPDAVMENLFSDPKGDLAEIVLYHMVPGRHAISGVAANRTVATVQGSPAPVDAGGGRVTVGGATVVRADIPAANGIIHVVDAVMLPPGATLPAAPTETAEAENATS